MYLGENARLPSFYKILLFFSSWQKQNSDKRTCQEVLRMARREKFNQTFAKRTSFVHVTEREEKTASDFVFKVFVQRFIM
jgi:hypothetical protein